MRVRADTIIVSTSKAGHYANYALICAILIDDNFDAVERISLHKLMFANNIIFIDGDAHHLRYLPFVILRSLLKLQTTFLSVRTEDLLAVRLKSLIKRWVVRCLVSRPYTQYISIHYPYLVGHEGTLMTDTVYDPQLWDLPLFHSKAACPYEISSEADYSSAILVLGTLNKKRCADELLNEVTAAKDKFFVFAGKASKEHSQRLLQCENVLMINRYVSDEEIIWLYNTCGFIYAFYSQDVERPSGIMGRGIQFNKMVIVRKDGYLHKNYEKYTNFIPLDSVVDLRKIELAKHISVPFDKSIFDHKQKLKNILCG